MNDSPPSNATDLQVNTTRLVPDGSDLGSPLIDPGANLNVDRNDTLFIRTANQNKVKTASPFNISRLLSNHQQWNGKNGETANYCLEPVQPTSSSLPPPHDGNNNSTSTKPKSKSILRKTFSRGNKGVKSVVNNGFVTILMCVCLFGCLPHSSASAYEASLALYHTCPLLLRLTLTIVFFHHHCQPYYTYKRRCCWEYNGRCWC